MLFLLIYIKSLLQNTVFFIFLLKTFGAYCFLFYLCTRFQEMPPCGFFFSIFVLWEVLHIQRSSTRSVCRIFDVGRWVKETSYHFSWFWCFELDTLDEGSEQRQMECVASLVRQRGFSLLFLWSVCDCIFFIWFFTMESLILAQDER